MACSRAKGGSAPSVSSLSAGASSTMSPALMRSSASLTDLHNMSCVSAAPEANVCCYHNSIANDVAWAKQAGTTHAAHWHNLTDLQHGKATSDGCHPEIGDTYMPFLLERRQCCNIKTSGASHTSFVVTMGLAICFLAESAHNLPDVIL